MGILLFVGHTWPLSSAEAPSVEKRQENGQIKTSGAHRAQWEGLSFPFSPAPVRFIYPLPIPQSTEKMKETSAEERDTWLRDAPQLER